MERRELMQGFHFKIDSDFSLFITLTKQPMNFILFLIILRLFFCRANGMLDAMADASYDYYDPWAEAPTYEESIAVIFLCTIAAAFAAAFVVIPAVFEMLHGCFCHRIE